MGWPQLALLAMWTAGIGVHLTRHGEPIVDKDGEPTKYHFPARLIATSVWVALLWAGGFFDS